MEFIQYCSDIGGFLGFVVFYLLLKQKATDKSRFELMECL